MADADGGVVLKATAGEGDEFVLEIGDIGNAAAAKEGFLDREVRHLAFRSVDDELAIFGLAVRESHRERADAAFVRAPAGTGIALVEHLVGSEGSFARHEGLGDGAAMEEDDLVLVIAIIVVPIKNRRGMTGSEGHGAHRDGAAEVDFARSDDTPIVEFGKKDAGANAENLLHLVPATERDRVEMVFRDVFVDNDGDLREGLEFGRRARRAVRIGGKAFDLGFDAVIDLIVM